MDAVFICQSNSIRHAVTLRSRARLVPDAWTSPSLTSSKLSMFVSDENKRRRNRNLLHLNRSLRQLFLLAVIVRVLVRSRSEVEVRANITNGDKEVYRLLLAPSYRVVGPCLLLCAFSLFTEVALGFPKGCTSCSLVAWDPAWRAA